MEIRKWNKKSKPYIDLLKSINQEDFILDPFSGSGTTLLTAKELGINGIGFETNPFLAFTAKVKLTDFNENEIKELKRILKNVQNLEFEPSIKPPKLSISKKLFREQLKTTLMIKEYIQSIKNTKLRDLLALAFLCVLEDASYAKKDGNGLKYPKSKKPKNMKDAFIKQITLMILDLNNYSKNSTMTSYIYNCKTQTENDKNFSPISKTYLFHEDCRKIDRILQNKENVRKKDLLNEFELNRLSEFKDKISLIVFSPPYMNCFDYTEIYKIELWFGDFVKEYSDLKDLRRDSLTSHMNKSFKDDASYQNQFTKYFSKLLKEKNLWNKKIPLMVRGYFGDMWLNLGFQKCHIEVARHLGTSSQQYNKVNDPSILRESLIILKK
ncbi:MAG: DNA methyltransferase [Candidatus Lokiarchaeota archaeon]